MVPLLYMAVPGSCRSAPALSLGRSSHTSKASAEDVLQYFPVVSSLREGQASPCIREVERRVRRANHVSMGVGECTNQAAYYFLMVKMLVMTKKD